jgi:hypothetical protein
VRHAAAADLITMQQLHTYTTQATGENTMHADTVSTLPSDPENMNERRAGWADGTLLTFTRQQGDEDEDLVTIPAFTVYEDLVTIPAFTVYEDPSIQRVA